MANSAKRILVVGPSWVGDMVMAQSLFMTLKNRHPGATLGVVAPEWSQPILERMPEVDEVLPLAVGHGEFGLASRRELAVRLRGRFDRAIVLPRSWKAALVPFMARIPERIGFLGEHRYGLLKERRKLDKQVLDQTVKRFVSLGLPLEEAIQGEFEIPTPRLTIDRNNLVNLRLAHALSSRPAIGMMPGAEYGPAKQWPLDYFHALAVQLVKDGFEVRVLGGPKDHAAGESIVKGLPHAHNLCGKTQLADAVDLLADCRQVVTNDSGLMHVAAAVGVRIHALYGSSSPRYTPPLTDNAAIHYLALSCSPCFKRTCPLGHTNCLNDLDVEQVYRAMRADSQRANGANVSA
ncbi:lipopolysaccharide heptosyltransferase II [Vreelandella venusta]|uniref:lipopolysaccharide heptosyltransferase II n=1 Tax=Vreelandella venusta TaxID=44935 RepID=A0AAQ0CHP7_9GAMM|nr:lipopolysaccharide heptosyltransferase II [Halomonas venusta]MBR9924778.1 lipopolysaccharide heptosyltransferase II [Gammaproteobacteria bacterium]AZM94177.1 lipopolysaccharide heptosyltransferase II [Halomonas venusta]MDX1354457.1 lipopolysaccharide heptosyltransferase II [Halomonas venusta]MDX1712333.1 lipopolysaccharide heptosyltransferase II [Halomonas venusta]NPT32421.1 lipopolysaccharide heptosyltransferase II [Halomonas venusta]